MVVFQRNDTTQQIEDPHLSLVYKERPVLDDACNLLLHHVRRQSSIQKDDKKKIKQLLKHFIPDIFRHTRMDLSDDENDGTTRCNYMFTKAVVFMSFFY